MTLIGFLSVLTLLLVCPLMSVLIVESAGGTIHMVCRNEGRAEAAKEEIVERSKNQVRNLSDLKEDKRRFTDLFGLLFDLFLITIYCFYVFVCLFILLLCFFRVVLKIESRKV